MKSVCTAVLLLAALHLMEHASAAQMVTGSITGAVVDQSKSAVPGAEVKLIAENTSAVRETSTDTNGSFQFNAVLPGEYTLAVERAGFKRYVKQNIQLTPNENLSVSTVQLDVGEVTESVTVEAEGAAVQTASAERSGWSHPARSRT